MSDQTSPKNPGSVWRAQPPERIAVSLQQIVNRRADELYSSTRSEILMSIGAAVLLVVVMAWRFSPARDTLVELGFAAAAAWVVISLYWFRHRIERRDRSSADQAAATGLEYYRKELERRRDHLRNGWLWHGPLLLACLILIAVLTGRTFLGFDRFEAVLPLVGLLVVWTGFGVNRRLRQARQVQTEIDELERSAQESVIQGG